MGGLDGVSEREKHGRRHTSGEWLRRLDVQRCRVAQEEAVWVEDDVCEWRSPPSLQSPDLNTPPHSVHPRLHHIASLSLSYSLHTDK